MALAWLLAIKDWIVPIPGTTNRQHLKENIGALNVNLEDADIKFIDEGFSRIIVSGERTKHNYFVSSFGCHPGI